MGRTVHGALGRFAGPAGARDALGLAGGSCWAGATVVEGTWRLPGGTRFVREAGDREVVE